MELYQRFSQNLYYSAYRIVKNAEDALDAVQEGFITAFQRLEQYNGEGSFEGWLHKIVVRKSIAYYQKNKRFVRNDQLENNAELSINQEEDTEFTFELEKGKCIVHREIEKMSKSKYNVVNPDEICDTYGADTLRIYEMFLGPIEQAKPWNTAGISGVHNFLKKYWKLFHKEDAWIVNGNQAGKKELKVLHETIKKVSVDIENFSFNTCVSSLMICVNELTNLDCHSEEILTPLTLLLSPFAPHIAEEIWEKLGNTSILATASFPMVNETYLVEDTKNYPVSFNGKMRYTIPLSLSLDNIAIQEAVLADKRTAEYLGGKTPKKWIIVPNKIINIVF